MFNCECNFPQTLPLLWQLLRVVVIKRTMLLNNKCTYLSALMKMCVFVHYYTLLAVCRRSLAAAVHRSLGVQQWT